jgi:hypothetical protein
MRDDTADIGKTRKIALALIVVLVLVASFGWLLI